MIQDLLEQVEREHINVVNEYEKKIRIMQNKHNAELLRKDKIISGLRMEVEQLRHELVVHNAKEDDTDIVIGEDDANTHDEDYSDYSYSPPTPDQEVIDEARSEANYGAYRFLLYKRHQ